MIKLHEQYVIASNGEKVSVVLPIHEYRQLLSALEEVESIRAYDEAKASDDEVIPFDQAIDEIDRRG